MRDISLHVLDIAQNSISGDAKNIEITIKADSETGYIDFIMSDDGRGMDDEFLKSVIDPFVTTRTTRKVGLGIPMLKASCERTGGKFEIYSEKFKGTIVKASFCIENIDRIPLGDISETITGLVASQTDIEFLLNMQSMNGSFIFNTKEIKTIMNEVPINNLEVLSWIKEYINDGIKMIFGGVLNEIHS